jgi:hypothetical protein
MKRILIPAPIQLRDPVSGKPSKPQFGPDDVEDLFTFRRYAIMFWLSDVRWHKHLPRLVIVASLFEREEGEIHLEDHDYAILESIVKAPTEENAPKNSLVAIQLLAFPQAVLDARVVDDAKSAAKKRS